MISTFSTRKTTATIASRQTELVVIRLDIRLVFFPVKEFAGHKFVLKFILFTLTSWSSITLCRGRTGSFNKSGVIKSMFLDQKILFFFIMGSGFAFPAKCCSSFQVSAHLSACSAICPDHPSLTSPGRLTLPCLSCCRSTLNPCLDLGRCTYCHP